MELLRAPMGRGYMTHGPFKPEAQVAGVRVQGNLGAQKSMHDTLQSLRP